MIRLFPVQRNFTGGREIESKIRDHQEILNQGTREDNQAEFDWWQNTQQIGNCEQWKDNVGNLDKS